MQPASISYGKETKPATEEQEEGTREAVIREESGTQDEECVRMNPGQVDAVALDVQQETAAPAGSNRRRMKMKMRREKKKLMKKQLKSADTDALISELPFSLTSPTTLKELEFSSLIQKERKRKRGDHGGRVDSEEDAEMKKKKASQRPNYFVSIPITNKQISSAVMEIQEAVLRQEPRLAKAMLPVPTLHITLLVTHLASQEQVDLAATALDRSGPPLAELLGGRDLVLPFSGIGHFRKEVVFVSLAPGLHRHTLDSAAELLRSEFEEQGLLQEGNRGFEPHLTIMKLSRASKLRSQGIKRVDPALYSSYTNKFFGDQTVERLDLCSMLKKKQQDGYYHTEMSLKLDVNPLRARRSSGRRRSEPDEAELLRVSRRLVEDAVSRALLQYKQESLQNGGGPNATPPQPPGDTEELATKADTTANAATASRK
ncbi:A kinase (PRKA) anchor protein 7 isoform X2 [Gasterosteus aculeatus]